MSGAPEQRRKPSPRARITFAADNRYFVCTSMLYLIASALWIAWQGGLVTSGPLRSVGVHLFAAGFVLPLIYGLAAHMLPRFTGTPIASGWPAWLQFGTFNAGLLLFLAGALARSRAFALPGAMLLWLSFAIFSVRVWRVLWPDQATIRRR